MNGNDTFDHSFKATLLISIVYPLGPAAIILMPMIVGGLIDSHGFSEQQAGAIASLEGAGVVVASVIASIWIRKISWTRVLLISSLVSCMLNFLSANLSDFNLLLATRFLTGVSAGTLFAITVAALGDNRQPDRAFGIAQALQGLMMFAAFTATPFLIEAWSINGIFYMLSVVFLLITLCAFRFPAEGVQLSSRIQSSELPQGSTLLIWLGLFASVIFCVNIFGFWAFIERIGQLAGMPAKTIGLTLGASQLIAVAGASLAAVAGVKYGRSRPLLIVVIGQIVVLWLLIGKFSSFGFFIGTGVFQALFMVGMAYQMGAIAKIDLKGRFLVLMTAAQGIGAAIGPSIAASLISGNDYSAINYMAMLCCLLAVLMFLFIVHRTRLSGQ